PLPSDATALNWIENGSADPAGSSQSQPGNAGSISSFVVRLPTPIELRFQNESRIGSSFPVARSWACTATQAMRPSGKPVGKLWPLPVLATVIAIGAGLPAGARAGPRPVIDSTLRRRSQ